MQIKNLYDYLFDVLQSIFVYMAFYSNAQAN